uniref:Uncharacterized protein n=1 Tax=Tanacetum cinerariifolium TaxID=118510 RepID=A0A699HGE5_TANCI|nr:hypothetical protein [Tanacetum cinerariifolium]
MHTHGAYKTNRTLEVVTQQWRLVDDNNDVGGVAEWRGDDEGGGSAKVEEMAVVAHKGVWRRPEVEWPEMAGISPVVVAEK